MWLTRPAMIRSGRLGMFGTASAILIRFPRLHAGMKSAGCSGMPSYLIIGSDGAIGSSIIWPNKGALRFHRMSAVLSGSPASFSSCACSGVVAMTCSVPVFLWVFFVMAFLVDFGPV